MSALSGDALSGSGSVLFKNGIAAAVSGGTVFAGNLGRDDPYYYYLKLGYQNHFWNVGETGFSVDFGQYNNFAKNGDTGNTAGVGVIQDVDVLKGLQVYGGYRFFSLDRPGFSFEDIHTIGVGVYFSFTTL